ncbi:MAG: hypothetical protein ACPHEP_05290 [Acidimicrobiales bacterium]|jgi:hypothetical protein
MKVRVRIYATIDSEAYWVPADSVLGVESDLEDLLLDAVEDCLDGFDIKKIEVKVYDNI